MEAVSKHVDVFKPVLCFPGRQLDGVGREHDVDTLHEEKGVLDSDAKSLDETDPFGNEDGADVKYKTMTWWQAGMILIAETISLGILALPAALSTLGLVPGVFAIVGIGILSTYTGFVIGQLKRRYMRIHTMADAGEILLGRFGKEILGAAQLIFFIFIMGSHILTFSIMMNVLTEHATCTIIFALIGLITSLVLTLPRRLEDLSRISIVSFISIIGAVFTTMVGVSVENIVPKSVALFSSRPTVHDAFLAIASIIFAYAGHVSFFTLFSELRDIREYPKALALLQINDTVLYTVAAVVIYLFVGSDVASPALNSARPLMRKVAYGIAMPTIIVAGVVNGHVAVKFIYVRIFRGSNAMHRRSLVARGTWFLICALLWVLSWVVAEAIPVFNDLLGLAGSLFASWFTFGLSGIFWLHLNRGRWFRNWKKTLLLGLNVLNITIALVMCLVGLYSFIMSIQESWHDKTSRSFSCVDNSGLRKSSPDASKSHL